MLIETVKRHDSQRIVKLASIDDIRARGKAVPSQIHSVPALLVLPEKRMLFGKQVFDYLLLPNQGILMTSKNSEKVATNEMGGGANGPGGGPSAASDPIAFSMNTSSNFSDAFSTITEDPKFAEPSLTDRTYNWTFIEDDNGSAIKPSDLQQEETRSKKTIDLDAYKMQRDLELNQSDINSAQMPTSESTRI